MFYVIKMASTRMRVKRIPPIPCIVIYPKPSTDVLGELSQNVPQSVHGPVVSKSAPSVVFSAPPPSQQAHPQVQAQQVHPQIVFEPYISGEVLESFCIKITLDNVTYVSKSFTGNDCPPYFKGRLSYYMAALEEAMYRKNYELAPYDNKLSAMFYYGTDMDITDDFNGYHILLAKQ